MAVGADGASPAIRARRLWRRLGRALYDMMPKGLYARSLLIIIIPIVILQAVVAFVFMERHWQRVTARLSAAVTASIAGLIDVYETYPEEQGHDELVRIAREHFGLIVSFLPAEPLPPPGPKPFFSLLDRTLSEELTQQIGRPFWIDTVGRSRLVEIRIELDDAVMRVFARRSLASVSNSHIFILWMVGASLILLGVAVVFLRNQLKPIVRLAEAADRFGKGRDVDDFRPGGAREVRQAAHAFLQMKHRIERQIEQRTTMLAGVSHDLRTILTRFKLELSFFPDVPEAEELRRDVEEMQQMLEDYMAFARGDGGEQPEEVDVQALLESLRAIAERTGDRATVRYTGAATATLKPNAMKRCLGNLVANASRHGSEIAITGIRGASWLTFVVEDDGPGVPPELREDVFRPFYRVENSRNRKSGGTGLGLSIARDVARSHGGEITLGESEMGGLKVTVRIPV
ncbi:ATP-binding protein [Lutibaculum baratangense]|uniref:histidine kinase n=1 Tax=Lutibaculum baratangense AMV1 TaxID=631454 RepID=V4T9L3_9HYPH|nr:ATP-binding protein [Lutibaculum baratangense]ESR23208.1 Osmolarity sensor protein EnvZ [Lutibaculum baratangense AMV1]